MLSILIDLSIEPVPLLCQLSQELGNSVGRKNELGGAQFDRLSRHAEDDGTLLVLDHGHRPPLLHLPQLVRAIPAHSGQEHPRRIGAVDLRHRMEETIHRRAQAIIRIIGREGYAVAPPAPACASLPGRNRYDRGQEGRHRLLYWLDDRYWR